MNIISIDPSMLSKYNNVNYIKNQLTAYQNWLIDYSKNGMVAFSDFYLGYTQDDLFVLISKTIYPEVYGIGFNHGMKLSNGHTIGGNVLASCIYDYENMGFQISVDINVRDERWLQSGITSFDDFSEEQKYEIGVAATTWFAIFAKVQTDAMKSQKKIIKMCDPIKTRSKKYDQKDIYYKPILLSPGIQYIYQKGPSNRTEFVRHCEAWSVRGHFRHYKSGKTIYISPFQKGSGRLKDTTYKIKE